MSHAYDTDILLWSAHQADLLRRLAAGERVNDRIGERVGLYHRSWIRGAVTVWFQANIKPLR